MDRSGNKKNVIAGKKFKCNLCGKSYSNGASLRNHKVRHLRVEDLPYKCSSCEFKSVTKLDITRHIQSHSINTLHQCTYCSKKFKRDSNLKEHIRVVHAKVGSYDCQLCSFSTLRRSSLHSHMKSHDESFIECVCPICGSKFKSKAIFKYHLLSHADAKSFCCKECGKMFTIASRLRRHERHVHGPKNFECSNCHKTFPTVHHLKRHNLIHTGDKPYSCCFCSHSSSTQGNIVKHIKLIHGKIEESFKYFIKENKDNGFKKETIIGQEEMDYLKTKGKDIAISFLNVLNRKGLSHSTFEQLNEKFLKEDHQKITELQNKVEKLANSRKNICPKNCNVNVEKKIRVDAKKTKLQDTNSLAEDYFVQHEEKIVENDHVIVSPNIKNSSNKSKISPQLVPKAISSRSLEEIVNIKQIKLHTLSTICGQFILDANGQLSTTSEDIQENGLKLNLQNQLHCTDTFDVFGNLEYSNLVLISQEEFDKNGKYNQLFHENDHLLSKDSFKEKRHKLLELKNKVDTLLEERVTTSESMSSSKEEKVESTAISTLNWKRKKCNGSKPVKGNKCLNFSNRGSTQVKKLSKVNHKHILPPLLISSDNNDLRANPNTSVTAIEAKDLSQIKPHYKSVQSDENSVLDSKLDHIYYNFKILPSAANLTMTEIEDTDFTVKQMTLNGENSVVVDTGKSKYLNSKNIVNLYVTESSNFVSEDNIFKPEKELAESMENTPCVLDSYSNVSQVYESQEFLGDKSSEENELCYQLLNLGSNNVLKFSTERTPSKLQINIQTVDNIGLSVPCVFLDHGDTVKEFEKITINDTLNQVDCSNEDVNLESIAEVEETGSSVVTLHIVNDN